MIKCCAYWFTQSYWHVTRCVGSSCSVFLYLRTTECSHVLRLSSCMKEIFEDRAICHCYTAEINWEHDWLVWMYLGIIHEHDVALLWSLSIQNLDVALRILLFSLVVWCSLWELEKAHLIWAIVIEKCLISGLVISWSFVYFLFLFIDSWRMQ